MVDSIVSRSHDMGSAQEYNEVVLMLIIISSSPFLNRLFHAYIYSLLKTYEHLTNKSFVH